MNIRSWLVIKRIIIILLLTTSFLLGVIVQKQFVSKLTSGESEIGDGLLHGSCPLWGLSYKSEINISEEFTKNPVGRLDVFSGQITMITGNNLWQVRTPLTNTNASIDKNTYIQGNRKYKVGDCITYVSDSKRTIAIFPQQ